MEEEVKPSSLLSCAAAESAELPPFQIDLVKAKGSQQQNRQVLLVLLHSRTKCTIVVYTYLLILPLLLLLPAFARHDMLDTGIKRERSSPSLADIIIISRPSIAKREGFS